MFNTTVHCCVVQEYTGVLLDCAECANGDIESVDLTGAGIATFAPAALSSMGPQVTHLNLTGGAFEWGLLPAPLVAATEAGGALPALRSLHVSHCGLQRLPWLWRATAPLEM